MQDVTPNAFYSPVVPVRSLPITHCLPKYNERPARLNPLFQALHDQIAANSGPDRFFNHFYSLRRI